MKDYAMSITLPRKLETRIQEKVSSGAYSSSAEVLSESLRLLEQRDQKHAQLKQDIQVGLDQLDRGEGRDGKDVFADLRAKYADKS